MQRLERIVVAVRRIAVILLFASGALLVQPQFARAATAAFVDFDRTPLGTALEAQLPAAPSIQWVERAQLDLLLRERRLQAAFTPEGAAARLEIGKLVHADVLVLLRKRVAATKSDEAGYDLVICETRRGLRTTSLALTESRTQPLDAAKLAPTLLDRVAQATQEACFVYTVPPLIGRDLAYRYSHLQRGYAELLTQRLLSQPGTAVVESAETRATAAERVAAGNTVGQADYATPIFITGEFRHEGSGESQRVHIQLTARRGEAAVVDPTTGKIWRGPKDFGITAGLVANDQRTRQRSFIMMTPLRPGEVFAVITQGRTLPARVQFNPAAEPAISLTSIYECPEGAAGTAEDGKNPKLSFKASYLAALPANADRTESPQHILFGRAGTDSRAGVLTMNSKERQANPEDRIQPRNSPPLSPPAGSMSRHPLLVDLATNRVEALPAKLMPTDVINSDTTGVAVAGNQVFYTAGRRYVTNLLTYQKYDLANGATTVLDADSPTGFVFFTGDQTHVVGAHWWKKKSGNAKFTRVTPTVPWAAINLALGFGSKFDVNPNNNPATHKLYTLRRVYGSAHYSAALLLSGMNVEGRLRSHYVQLDVPSPLAGR